MANEFQHIKVPPTHKPKPSKFTYTIANQTISRVNYHPYIGVTINAKLSWTKHIQSTSSKSANTLGLLKRTLYPTKPKVKEAVYDHRRTTSVTHIQSKLGWQTIETQRLKHQLVFLFKLKYNLLNIYLPHVIVTCTRTRNSDPNQTFH